MVTGVALQEIPEGYKQTDVGVIPEDWEVYSLAKICTMKSGDTITSAHINGNSKYPCYGGNGLRGYTNRFTHNGEYSLIGRQGALCGNVLGVKGEFFASEHAIVVTPSKNTNITWLTYVLRRMNLNQYSESSAQPGLSVSKLLLFKIAFPSFKEQTAIATALSDVDDLITALEKVIEKKRSIKTAAMGQLLTGKKRLPPFDKKHTGYKQTEVGVIPEDWGIQTLERVSAFITKGSTPTTYGFKWEKEGVLFLRSECVSENGLDLSESMFISKRAHKTLRRSEVQSGDILITITGNVGRLIYLDEKIIEGNINQHIAKIRVISDKVNPNFIFQYLSQKTVRRYYRSITTGQAYPQISLTQVRNTSVPLPNFKEQTAIAKVLSDMDKEIEALEHRLVKTQKIKQGMMQELLTGRTRLV